MLLTDSIYDKAVYDLNRMSIVTFQPVGYKFIIRHERTLPYRKLMDYGISHKTLTREMQVITHKPIDFVG